MTTTISTTAKKPTNDFMPWHEVAADTAPTPGRKYGKRGQTYTLAEVAALHMVEPPMLTFGHKNGRAVIQRPNSLTTLCENNPRAAESKWEYKYVTDELIPVFHYNDSRSVEEIVKIEASKHNYAFDKHDCYFWICFITDEKVEPAI